MNTIIFDIDGTLVDSTVFDTDLYIRAVREVLGKAHIHDDWGKYVHVTDAGILDQILLENGISEAPTAHGQVKEAFWRLVQEHLDGSPCVPVPGALAALDKLADSNDCQIGLATGGWRFTAMAKLRSAGFDVSAMPMSSSDDSCEREEIMRSCHGKFGATPSATVYIGDGPWDLRAARDLGWGFIAIGDRLKGMHQPWIQDYLDPNWSMAPNQAMQADAFGAADF